MRFFRFALVGLVFVALAIMGTGCGNSNKEKVVVVYISVDQEFAEPILKKFESSSGIKVMPVYDVEAAKTTGLVNRLISEKSKPQADVFWNSEFMQTMLLKERGALAAYQSPAAGDLSQEYRDKDNQWTAFGGRARVLIYNTNLVPEDQIPKSIYDLPKHKYGGSKAAIAYPMFGTSATHAAALYALLGPDKAKEYFADLKASKVQVVDGNSVVRDLVAQGQLAMGLTDSDDALGSIEKGAPVKVVIPDQDGEIGTLVTPNTVALISGAPHADSATKLIDYLVSKEVEEELMRIGFSQVSTRNLSTGVSFLPKGQIQRMKIDFPSVYCQLETAKKDLTDIFVR